MSTVISACSDEFTTSSSIVQILDLSHGSIRNCWASPSPTTAKTSSRSRRATRNPGWHFNWRPFIPQQMHLDIMVESISEAMARVLALGARKLDGADVFADPAGHPFCLIKRPGWAAPLSNWPLTPDER